MGGQACVFYGAAESSRDTDLVILADVRNLACLRRALNDLEAAVIAAPLLARASAVRSRGAFPVRASGRLRRARRRHAGKVMKKFKRIGWDGWIVPNEVMMQQQTWNDILTAMIQVRENHG
jgi:hypothetical protein